MVFPCMTKTATASVADVAMAPDKAYRSMAHRLRATER